MRRGSAWPEPMIGGHARSPASTTGARSTSSFMSEEQRNLEVVARLGELWNAGQHEEVLSLYHEDAVMTAAPNWLEPGPWVGREQIARNQRDWVSAWEQIEMEVERVEAAGDKVVLLGQWHSRGAASGIGNITPIAVVFTLEDGLIKRFDWLESASEALRRAGIDE